MKYGNNQKNMMKRHLWKILEKY